MKNKHTYIAGKITGLDYALAWSNFNFAEVKLRNQCKTINPMRLCSPQWGWWRCMVVCLWTLITRCDRIYLLDNWTESRGARLEVFVALVMRKKIMQ